MSEENDPIEDQVEAILKELGEDPGRDGLIKTPERVAKAYRFLTSGYDGDPQEILNGALFDVDYDESWFANLLERICALAADPANAESEPECEWCELREASTVRQR